MNLKITDTRATLHRVPVQVPLLKEKISTSVVFATVETDQGVTGYGLTAARNDSLSKSLLIASSRPSYEAKIP